MEEDPQIHKEIGYCRSFFAAIPIIGFASVYNIQEQEQAGISPLAQIFTRQ